MASKKLVNDDELEENWVGEAVEASDDEDVVSAGSEDEFEEDYDLELATNKRSREEATAPAADGDDEAMEPKAAVPKKQKTQTVPKPSKGLHKMTAAEHFKIVNDIYAKARGGQMTSLELAEGLNESHFAAPTGLGKHKLELLPAYMHHFLPHLKKEFLGKKKKYDKSPYFLIVCSSALRAVEVLKHLNVFKCKVAKLFAKHIKVTEQTDVLERQFHPIAVGTPGRIKTLLEVNALSLQHTTHVIIDMEKDKKTMTILELKDTAKEMVDLLQFHFIPKLRQGRMKLALY